MAYKNKKYANMKYWTETTVVKILSNEMYIGNMVQGRSRRSLYNNLPFKLVDKEDWIIVENTHEAIISKEDFYKVQEMFAEYNRKPKVRGTHKKDNILKGLVVCGECGHKMGRSVSKNDGKSNNYFICRQHSMYPDSCDSKSIRENVLKNIVFQSIKFQIKSLSKIEDTMIASANAPKTKKAMYSLTKQISEVLSNIAYIKENRIKISKDYAKQLLNGEEYEILIGQFDAELAKAVEILEKLEKQRSKFNKLFTADKWISELRQYSSTKKLSLTMVNEFVKCIKVYADMRIEIEWKYKDTIAEYLEMLNGGVELVG